MDEKKNSVICIIGMHRSGTSMVARLLNLCGLDLGPSEQLMEPDDSNPLGYFENENFSYKIDDALLAHFGGSWDNPPLFKEGWESDPSLDKINHEANLLLKTFSNSSKWGWKDPRATILLPFWKLLIPDLRLVICVRGPLEVAESLAKRDKMSIERSVHLWNQYMRAAIRDTEGCPRIFTFYEDFFKDTPSEITREINRLVEFCGLQKPDDLSSLHDTISHELKHHTSETLELLNEDKVITEYKLFYIGLRALTTEGFVPSTSNSTREALVSENISKFFNLLEQFHDEQEMAQLQSEIADKEQQVIQLAAERAQLAEKENEVVQVKAKKEELKRLLTLRDDQIRQMAEEKKRNYQFWLVANDSFGWRVITKCRSLEEKLMPKGTFRRAIYDLCWKSLKAIAFRGWSSFIKEAKNKLNEFRSSSGAIKGSSRTTFNEEKFLNDIDITRPEGDRCILVIDRFVPTNDKDSGSMRMYSILRILKEIGYNVTLFPDVFNKKKAQPYLSELQGLGIYVLDKKVNFEKYLVKMGHIFTFVIISRPEIAFKYTPSIRAYAINSSIIYDTVDLHWLRMERAASVTGKVELSNEAKHYKSMEIYNAICSDTVFTVTNNEKELLLKEIPELKIEVIPNVHDVVKVAGTFRERKNIMFIGGFLHQPNEDAVFYFIREILPIVKEKIKDLKFLIIGSDPPKSFQKLNSKDIVVTGYVKDVAPYFTKCRVFVSPLRYGAGIKGKIGQSMSYGLPVVTTKIGAEGMELLNGENALIADEPEEFAEAIIRLYTDESLWNKISLKSIEHIERNYSKEIIGKKIAAILQPLKPT